MEVTKRIHKNVCYLQFKEAWLAEFVIILVQGNSIYNFDVI